jgi:hypothetical protein
MDKEVEISLGFRNCREDLSCCCVKPKISESPACLIARRALQVRPLVNYAGFLKEFLTLRDECRVTDMIGGFDVIL